MNLQAFLPELLVVLLAGAGVTGALLRGRRRRPRPAPKPQPYLDYAPGVGDDAEVPRDTPLRTVEPVAVDIFSAPIDAAAPSADAPSQEVDEPLGEVSLEDVASLEDVIEQPAPAAGRLRKLRQRLARSNNAVGKSLLSLLSRDSLESSVWDEIEETLLVADLGVAPTHELIDRLKTAIRVDSIRDEASARSLLRTHLIDMVDPSLDRSLAAHVAGRPAVVLVVGVNGTGKTTTTGKLARVFVAEGRTVLLGAADTFRAAASDQLHTWGERVGAAVVRGPEGSDPAAVAFEAVDIAIKSDVDVALIDTAGRLHTKTGLMDELGKVKRVIEKQSPVDEVLLVIDATTGQNGLVQARVFAEAVNVTGIVLTKLDGTAKGGIVIAVQRELGVPVKLVGLGEGPDDLAPFDPEAFVDALVD